MQASQTLADTVDMYFFDDGYSVPKTKSTVSKDEKQNPCVFLAESSVCNIICISTNTQCPKATKRWKTWAASSSRCEGQARLRIPAQSGRMSGWAEKGGPTKARPSQPTTPHCAGGLGPGPTSTSSWAPGQAAARSARFLWPKLRTPGKNWHEETQLFFWVSSKSE